MTLAQWDGANGNYIVSCSSNPTAPGTITHWQLNKASGTEPLDAITTSGGHINLFNDSGVDDVVSIETTGPTTGTFANGLPLNPVQRILVT